MKHTHVCLGLSPSRMMALRCPRQDGHTEGEGEAGGVLPSAAQASSFLSGTSPPSIRTSTKFMDGNFLSPNTGAYYLLLPLIVPTS